MQATDASTQASADPAELAAALAGVMRHLMTNTGQGFFNEVERLGLSLSQIKTLGFAADTDAASLGAISDAIGLSLPAVSRAVEGLVQRGLLRRAEDPADRRSKRVSVTAKGRRTYDGLLELRAAGLRTFVDGLEPAERDALMHGLRPLIERPEIGALIPRR